MTQTKESGFESIPPHFRIVRYWRSRPEFRHVFDNEPCCFACRNGVYAWGELQRAHIVADCHDGSFEPDNFVLLCVPCHKEAPMVADREMFIRWVKDHPHFTQPITDAMQAIRALESYALIIGPEDPERFGQFLKSRRLKFHPHSTVAEKVRAIIFVVGEYLKLRDQIFGAQ